MFRAFVSLSYFAAKNVDCLFCKIANGDISSEVVYEDDDIKAFKDIHPKAPIHILVIPKAHIQSIAHLETSHREIVARVVYGAKQVAETKGLKGYKLVFNVGREGGQVIDHLHLHVLGGWAAKEEKKVEV